jgi:hypothetical protein
MFIQHSDMSTHNSNAHLFNRLKYQISSDKYLKSELVLHITHTPTKNQSNVVQGRTCHERFQPPSSV